MEARPGFDLKSLASLEKCTTIPANFIHKHRAFKYFKWDDVKYKLLQRFQVGNLDEVENTFLITTKGGVKSQRRLGVLDEDLDWKSFD